MWRARGGRRIPRRSRKQPDRSIWLLLNEINDFEQFSKALAVDKMVLVELTVIISSHKTTTQ